MPDYDVAVVGYGPVGAAVANLLGVHGISTVVLEHETGLHPLPRAVGMNDDVARILQAAGLEEAVREVVAPAQRIRFVAAGGAVLTEASITGDGENGHPLGGLYHQPELEAVLRRGVERFPAQDGHGVRVLLGHTVEAIHAEGIGATLRVRDRETGQVHQVRARYVLGCDGARSTVRRAAGAALRSLGFEQDWVVVDAEVPQGPVPQAPMIEQVLDPRRPTTRVTLAGGRRRWEFMLLPGETREDMARPAVVRALLAPHVDAGEVHVVRATGYRFHALVATSWRRGPLLLLGDAAHQMPPFLGQGLGEGIRDAHDVVWRLHLVLTGAADPSLLDGYERERRAHAIATARRSVRLGRVIGTRSRPLAAVRDRGLALAGRLPLGPDGFLGRAMRAETALPAHGSSTRGTRRPGEGALFPQPRVQRAPAGPVRRLDEELGRGWSVLSRDAEALTHLDDGAAVHLDRLGAGFLVTSARDGADAATANRPGDGGPPTLVDVEGTITAWLQRHGGARAVVLRPDRRVWAVLDAGQLPAALDALSAQLHPIEIRPGRLTPSTFR